MLVFISVRNSNFRFSNFRFSNFRFSNFRFSNFRFSNFRKSHFSQKVLFLSAQLIACRFHHLFYNLSKNDNVVNHLIA
ncbi:TPA: pentapeptide repeat-containing protein [Streptococcus pyogenes]|uniref:pentapeptide repeat-containing protein n=1 Tax=Streptococcus pyogenes TaxID=1314 RepID=UPI002B1BAB63|nr:pentapeptide repeat-containing protein [Streptococcus pyogenes]HEQ9986228.1 pentapeptide repeat-containing protein [Streptococcus pyogenes]HER1378440.1 pentapeptide repeat-containing protein [Streptococcus pyogenes]HER2601232.1 pentapeptide repeat-containing protein [Streptococcus pyogenes]HER7268896.1 pentapeptide repeat-containing protein [Streptococcus pyogenes]